MALATFNPNDSELLKKMVECMGDSQGMVRLSLAETLGSIGKPATPFLLEALAHHRNPVVRRASAKTLTLICEDLARTTLLEAFLHDEDQVGRGRVGLKTKPAVSNRAYTDKTHLECVKEFLLDRALTSSSQNERISRVAKQNSKTGIVGCVSFKAFSMYSQCSS
ncbi:HEAT repeat domain-containing protein [Microcoleus vaginatus]|uniref:HEAT repeat domain-containing protein n=1 Tax=Microcoleus vaginatus TaxID=119532 RepID=UPI001686E2B7|nr:HEAT repeat domain-containing protein [Microcoleus sp. FACHB-84]MBD2007557.1 HEAT repeat domain-containing protein [Microcoleus sp. FACHB-45]